MIGRKRVALEAMLLAATSLHAAETCNGSYFLRAGGGAAEWSDSPSQAQAQLACSLTVAPAAGPATLLLEQNGVKRSDWIVTLNEEPLGKLQPDEHKVIQAFELPAGLLRAADNELLIEPDPAKDGIDDIEVGRIRIEPLAVNVWLGAGRVQVRVVDEQGRPMPARITVTDAADALLPVGAQSGGDLAVRTGVIYTASGAAEFTLAEGEYTVYASRGFEYGVARQRISVRQGSSETVELHVRHEVNIPGWTSGDTHLHTRELSGHGDATVAERAITVAGEGLDWGITTEHNRTDNLPDLGGRFVAVRGSELTTQFGHFNVFPWPEAVPFVDARAPWHELWWSLPDGVLALWNHPRDDHAGYRPIDASHYVELAAEALDGRVFPGVGMEVVNSSAMYSHPLELVRDWMRQLNCGARIAAVGSSDTHTVSIVHTGQARTYARTGDGKLTAQDVADAFTRGETAVSYGLAAFLERDGGGLRARVYGPSWNLAKRVMVFANGEEIADFAIDAAPEGGLQWEGSIEPPKLEQDAWLAVVAAGDGDYLPYWPLNRPYQAVTPDWTAMTLGVSPALAWDGDADGRFQTAREISEGLVGGSPEEIAEALARHDSAVAAQAGFLLALDGRLEAVLAATQDDGLRARLTAVARQYEKAK